MAKVNFVYIKSAHAAKRFEAMRGEFQQLISEGEREINDLEQRLKQRKQALKEQQTHYIEAEMQGMSDDDKRQFILALYCHFGLRVGSNNLAALINDKGTSLGVERITAQYSCDDCGEPVLLSVKAADIKNGDEIRCICDDCGELYREASLQRRNTIEASIQTLRDMPYKEYLQTDHWKTIRRRALNRSDNKCQLCNSGDTVLDVHHRTYENRGNEHYKDVIVLCRPCHAKFHGKEV